MARSAARISSSPVAAWCGNSATPTLPATCSSGSVHVDRPCQLVAHAIAQRPHHGGIVAGRQRGQHQELVAAQPCHHIALAGERRQPLPDRPQHRVAGGMPVPIVDALEPVQVDEQHRHRRAVAAGAGKCQVEVPRELDAVGEPGEMVVIGKVGEPVVGCRQRVLDPVTIGDVGDDAVDQLPAVGGRAGDAPLPHPAGDAVEADQPVLVLGRLTAAQRRIAALVGLAVVRVDTELPGLLVADPGGDAAQQSVQRLADPDMADVGLVQQFHLVHVHAGGGGHAPKQRRHGGVVAGGIGVGERHAASWLG